MVAFEGPPSKTSPSLRYFIDTSNVIVFLLFALEALLKSIAFHFWSRPPGQVKRPAYFQRGSNQLDFLIVVVIGISYALAFTGRSVGFNLEGFGQAMRALQPIRMLNRIKGLQRISNALLAALPAVGTVFGLLVLFWLCFAIVGVEFFSGSLRRCVLSSNVYNSSYHVCGIITTMRTLN